MNPINFALQFLSSIPFSILFIQFISIVNFIISTNE